MRERNFSEIDEKYDLELDKVVEQVKKLKNRKIKLVLLQFPDGLKQYATSIVDELEKRLIKEKIKNVEFLIWLGSCFGACDVPNLGKLEKQIDLIVQFGHNNFGFMRISDIMN